MRWLRSREIEETLNKAEFERSHAVGFADGRNEDGFGDVLKEFKKRIGDVGYYHLSTLLTQEIRLGLRGTGCLKFRQSFRGPLGGDPRKVRNTGVLSCVDLFSYVSVSAVWQDGNNRVPFAKSPCLLEGHKNVSP